MVNQQLLSVDTATTNNSNNNMNSSSMNGRSNHSNSNSNISPSTNKGRGRLRYNEPDTPRTEASTPPSRPPTPHCSTTNTGSHNNNTNHNNHNTYAAVRGQSDIRSPGISKTPSVDPNSSSNKDSNANASSSSPSADLNQNNPSHSNSNHNHAPIPDFITQTDKYGNATTPRNPNSNANVNANANSNANANEYATPMKSQTQALTTHSHQHQQDGIETADTDETDPVGTDMDNGDACDTLLESLRMMCCCLLPDSNDLKFSNGHANAHAHANANGNTTMARSNHNSAISSTSGRRLQITKLRSSSPHSSGSGSASGYARYGHVDEQSNFIETNGAEIKLLPEIHVQDQGKKCLVLDLDETLVHSSFRAVQGADFVIPVQIEDVVHYVYVAKRPGVDDFLLEMSKHYEIILYTASLNKYADPLLDLLDTHNTIRTRLFRESCVYYEGNYVKDLSLLNRDLSKTIIVDNSPSSYIFHPENAIDCSSFIDDPADCELDQIARFLVGVEHIRDVRSVCGLWRDWPNVNMAALEFEDNGANKASGAGSTGSNGTGVGTANSEIVETSLTESRVIEEKQQKQKQKQSFRGRRRYRQQQQQQQQQQHVQ